MSEREAEGGSRINVVGPAIESGGGLVRLRLDIEVQERRDDRARVQVGRVALASPPADRLADAWHFLQARREAAGRAHQGIDERVVEDLVHQLLVEQAPQPLLQVVGAPGEDARERLHER